MKRIALRLAGSLALLTTLICLILPVQVFSAEIPPLPHAFYGSLLKTDGTPAPAGVTVTAVVNGVQSGSITTTEAGKYGSADAGLPKLIVQGYIQDGTPIQFYVSNVLATPSDPNKAKFKSGEVTQLDLTYIPPTPTPTPPAGGGGAPPAPTPTPTPTAAPSIISVEINISGTTSTTTITSSGVTQATITGSSSDGKLDLIIPAGTTVLQPDGTPPTAISITPDPTPPPPPADKSVIGLAYDCEPSGTTFNPPITLVWHYDPPPGVDELSLRVAFYDSATGTWVLLQCTVDPVNNTITAIVPHFSVFAILAAAPKPTPIPTITPTPTPTPQPIPTPQTPTPTKAPVPPPALPNWGLIGGIIAGVVVIVLVVFLLMRR